MDGVTDITAGTINLTAGTSIGSATNALELSSTGGATLMSTAGDIEVGTITAAAPSS